jgi:hypothetical protein
MLLSFCMSARKLGNSDVFQPFTVQSHTTRLSLPASAVRFRKNGIEFCSQNAIAPWTEMTVDLQTPLASKRFHSTGVVVACHGNRHEGYVVSLLFTNLSRQAQARLNSLAHSTLD